MLRPGLRVLPLIPEGRARGRSRRIAPVRRLGCVPLGLFLTVVLGCAIPGRALTPQAIFERSAPSVVRIDAETPTGAAVGTGFAVSETRIATNLHVIDGAEKVVVQLQDGSRFEVRRVIAIDDGQDLAIIETSAKGLRPLTMADSDRLVNGQRIYAIGNPLGLDYTITDGLFSGRRSFDDGTIDMLQVSASLSPGSSGGPLLNDRAEVVGVATRTLAAQAFGLGIPSNVLKRLAARPGRGTSFEDFVADRASSPARASRDARAAAGGGRRERQIPDHPIDLVSSCSNEELEGLVLSLIQAIERGAPAYNRGSPEDCYRIYEGAALRLTRELGTCDGGRSALEAGLDRASGLVSYDDKAWAMRDAFDGLLQVVRRYIETLSPELAE